MFPNRNRRRVQTTCSGKNRGTFNGLFTIDNHQLELLSKTWLYFCGYPGSSGFPAVLSHRSLLLLGSRGKSEIQKDWDSPVHAGKSAYPHVYGGKLAKFIKGFDSKHGCTKVERPIYYIYMPIRLGDNNPDELTTALCRCRQPAYVAAWGEQTEPAFGG
ncbi:hypothetical protein AFERRI_470010 [Acidithiobacillus ferrivorans]|uniref:Uncharacterized protein n=1 Tax=Acidithiobacillus ferrivorans TaxID=160808 RepID=A0A060URT3_9PROT|nr:hypothetical protein AFERRI_470010 [Acidithiobacillus ferrivorans]